MKSPYTAQVFIDVDPWRTSRVEPDFTLTWEENRDDLNAGMDIAMKFYRSGNGAGVLGTLRSAAFFVGATLGPGEFAYVRVLDREGKHTGYDTSVERDETGRVLSTLGSRWANNRVWQGV
jgi:hypothetical protein